MVLDTVASSNVRAYVVWTPVLHEDDRQAAVDAIDHVPDERATHFWDADKSLGFSLGRAVALPRGRKLAWDVYFVFDAGAKWDDGLPQPNEWMHQLGSDDRTLDGDRLRVALENLLKTSKVTKK